MCIYNFLVRLRRREDYTAETEDSYIAVACGAAYTCVALCVDEQNAIRNVVGIQCTKKNSTAIYMGAKIIDIMSGRAAANVFCRMLRNVKYVACRKRDVRKRMSVMRLVVCIWVWVWVLTCMLPVRKSSYRIDYCR